MAKKKKEEAAILQAHKDFINDEGIFKKQKGGPLKQCEFCYWCGQDVITKDYICCCEKSPNYMCGITRTQEACEQFKKGKKSK